jgi:hypothetical protein
MECLFWTASKTSISITVLEVYSQKFGLKGFSLLNHGTPQ